MPLRPVTMSSFLQRGVAHGGASLSGTTGDYYTDMDEVEELLTQLTISIPLTRDEDIPVCMRCHANGGGSHFA